ARARAPVVERALRLGNCDLESARLRHARIQRLELDQAFKIRVHGWNVPQENTRNRELEKPRTRETENSRNRELEKSAFAASPRLEGRRVGCSANAASAATHRRRTSRWPPRRAAFRGDQTLHI